MKTKTLLKTTALATLTLLFTSLLTIAQIPFQGLVANNEGGAGWDADGTGPEPAGYGHIHPFGWGSSLYYAASLDYDNIDPDPDAALAHFLDDINGFPLFEQALANHGFSPGQVKIKFGLTSEKNDIEGEDWFTIGDMHYLNKYDGYFYLELDGEAMVSGFIKNYFFTYNNSVYNDWPFESNFTRPFNTSSGSSIQVREVAEAFMQDMQSEELRIVIEHMQSSGQFFSTNGRDGVFHEITWGELKPELPAGTLVWDNEVSGMWDTAGSPYIVMGYIKIPDGETLTIEPGVEVKFNSTERFDIQGCLIAEGTEALPILFTAYDPDIKWGGMVWDQTPATNPNSVLKHCIFEHSYAYGLETRYNCGGAVRVNLVNSIDMSHCVFRYNSADKFTTNNPAGGALAMFDCSIHISHCIFHDNSSSWGGAIIMGSNSNPVIDNCLFFNNESTFVGGGGGAGLSWDNSSPHLVNCTFADNYAADAGGAYELEFGGTTTFTNCIFWGNTADVGAGQISVFDPDSTADLNIYYCDVEGGLNGIQPGFQGEYIENIDEYPEFITVGEYPYVPDTSYFNPSPCTDKGTENALFLPADYTFPLYCLRGNPRINGPVDMGCYESPLTVGFGRSVESDKAAIKVYPNPSSGLSEISYLLTADCRPSTVDLRDYDLKGKEITTLVNEKQQPGEYTVHFDASDLPAGIYLVRLLIGERNETAKLVVLK